ELSLFPSDANEMVKASNPPSQVGSPEISASRRQVGRIGGLPELRQRDFRFRRVAMLRRELQPLEPFLAVPLVKEREPEMHRGQRSGMPIHGASVVRNRQRLIDGNFVSTVPMQGRQQEIRAPIIGREELVEQWACKVGAT